jgi:hypothetical protein
MAGKKGILNGRGYGKYASTKLYDVIICTIGDSVSDSVQII